MDHPGAEGLTAAIDEGILRITIDRPHRHNAVTHDHWWQIGNWCQEAEQDDRVRVIVIDANGDEFCTGADLSELDLSADGGIEIPIATWHNFFAPLLDLTKPTIAVVNGAAAGGGLGLSLCCDVRIASDRAKFATSFTRVGLTANDGVAWLLPRVVGLPKALELIYLPWPISAAEAHRVGLVNWVVPHSELAARARDIARNIAQGPPVALRLSKRLVHDGAERSFREHCLAQEYSSLANRMLADHDIKEGSAAFFAKRSAAFRGMVPCPLMPTDEAGDGPEPPPGPGRDGTATRPETKAGRS